MKYTNYLLTVLFFLIISAGFSQNYNQVWDVSVGGHIVGMANLDNDPAIELLVLTSFSDTWKDYFNIIDGVSGDIEYSTQQGWYARIWSLSAIDVNNDGKSEILVSYSDGSNRKTKLLSYGSLGVTENGDEDYGFYTSNFPNPFVKSTTIEYEVEENGQEVTIIIYDQSGNIINTIEEGKKERGTYRVVWSGESSGGTKVSSGTYYYVINIGDKQGSKIMIKI